ncbi:flavodoxin domain-containing protein [Methylobacillus caricis]|uniref:sulfite reductase subunit alpha n=1 Tax=Methylobacillus caricis TaxID=1971611 RepID=UPI001CFFB58A|nr:sulfite reductase subunit alpha [Methylobacillus caricis]MCB5186530.1 flavodoxin domain-containing protein [Methylobacillus caricis]
MVHLLMQLIGSFLLVGHAHAAVNNLAFNRWVTALSIIVAYLLLCAWIYKRHKACSQADEHSAAIPPQAILVAYASQGGFARQLAQQTVDTLRGAGTSAYSLSLNELDAITLQQCRRALFLVSTTGEGDAPDNAVVFLQHLMSQELSLPSLEYGILALGDSSYANYCGFGHRLDGWLQHVHALPLFDLIEVDNGDAGALRHWQYQLGLLADNHEILDWQAPHYREWSLVQRQHLNPGSAGAPVYHLALSTTEPDVSWQAGDIAEIGPRNSPNEVELVLRKLGLAGETRVEGKMLSEILSQCLLPHDDLALQALKQLDVQALVGELKPLPHREYSIASLPEDGQLELLVRQTSYADGRLGLGSGWLTKYVEHGGPVALRIRENAGFHPPASDVPLILIGNGTGIAGLRAHLKARVVKNHHQNWLFFGERNALHDLHFADDLSNWQRQGVLSRLDTVFSRDQTDMRYVQDAVAVQAAEIRRWVLDLQAAVYVCGSATGMAPAVHHVLTDILGESMLTAMTVAGRYRRDIY